MILVPPTLRVSSKPRKDIIKRVRVSRGTGLRDGLISVLLDRMNVKQAAETLTD
jgi:hypothetical protein